MPALKLREALGSDDLQLNRQDTFIKLRQQRRKAPTRSGRITDQKSVANFTFGLINTEREDGFLWLCKRLEELRQDLHIPAPTVIITDKEIALKNALKAKSEDGGSNDKADDNKPEVTKGDKDLLRAQAYANNAAVKVNDNLAARAAEQEIAERGCAALLPAADPQSRKGIFRTWK
ncbi:hypothetical protein CI102_15397 [Trichoderma harzianum]|nr:hypothetical protein CI102_15397 [Trichoderma harzianum]